MDRLETLMTMFGEQNGEPADENSTAAARGSAPPTTGLTSIDPVVGDVESPGTPEVPDTAYPIVAWHYELICEAAARSGTIWLRSASMSRPRLAWHVWHDGAVWLVSGPGEQQLDFGDPSSATAPYAGTPVEVILPSKDDRSTVATFAGVACLVAPSDDAWPGAAAALAASRLNAELPAEMIERWTTQCQVFRIAPLALLAGGAGPDDSGAGARQPARVGATTRWRPWHLGSRASRG